MTEGEVGRDGARNSVARTRVHVLCEMSIQPRSSCPDLIRASIEMDDGSFEEGWMAGSQASGSDAVLRSHRRAEATPFFERLCPAMTRETDVARTRRPIIASDSEAIQSRSAKGVGLLRRFAPRNDEDGQRKSRSDVTEADGRIRKRNHRLMNGDFRDLCRPARKGRGPRNIASFPCHFAPLGIEGGHVRGPRTPGGLLRTANGPRIAAFNF